jgi:hypothetical protein
MNKAVFPRLAVKDPANLGELEERLAEQPAVLALDTVNWVAPKSIPQVILHAGYDARNLFLHFKVKEESVIALSAANHGTVWLDSCVEMFCAPAGDGQYYNLEMNCIGKALMACGSSRGTSRRLPLETLALVKIKSSLGETTFSERSGGVAWSLTASVPLAAFARHPLGDPRGQTWRANFYKCGEDLKDPHYLSWNLIDYVEPDFHRPEHFGEIRFA